MSANGLVLADETPVRASDRAAWERRAVTIQLKAQALLDDMISALGVNHILTDIADGVVEQSENLSDALRKRPA